VTRNTQLSSKRLPTFRRNILSPPSGVYARYSPGPPIPPTLATFRKMAHFRASSLGPLSMPLYDPSFHDWLLLLVVSLHANSFILKMEALRSCETLVNFNQTTRLLMPRDNMHILNSYCQNLKSSRNTTVKLTSIHGSQSCLNSPKSRRRKNVIFST
jgi:hypothetical protein